MKGIKKILNDNNKIKENQIKNDKNHINNNNNNIYRNYIIFIIINFIILNILYKIKCNNYDVLYFQYISNITLKIKGIGENTIFGSIIFIRKTEKVYIN